MQGLRVANFDSATPEYTQAFRTFLAHTDQKEKALKWLDREVGALAQRRIAIDAGAGTGKLTKWLAERFAAVIGIEPNPSLAAEFRAACPSATLILTAILAAAPGASADFILCSHVLYYIPLAEWEANVQQLLSWLAPGGVLAVAIQNPDTDCMKMVHHFIGRRTDLRQLASIVTALNGAYDVRLDTVPAYIRTEDFRTACEIAQFMLNVLPMPNPPLWSELEQYVMGRFARNNGGYQYSCHQDFLRIARR